MALLLITYDLKKETNSKDYEGIIGIIKKTGDWARLSESSYAVQTEETPKSLYDQLTKFLDNNDKLMVVTFSKPYFGRHSQAVIDWLAARM